MLLDNQKYWFHGILRIRYDDNRRQRENSKNLGVEGDLQCSTSAFKRRLDQKYLSTNGRDNIDDRQGYINIWIDEAKNRQTAIYNDNAKGDLRPRKS